MGVYTPLPRAGKAKNIFCRIGSACPPALPLGAELLPARMERQFSSEPGRSGINFGRFSAPFPRH